MALGDNIKREKIIPSPETAASIAQINELASQGHFDDSIARELAARVDALNAAAIMSEADPYGNIIFVNDRLCQVSGFSREEMIGQPHSMLRHPETPKIVFKQMWETIKSGQIFKGVYKNKKKDGSHYWVDATIAPVLDESGIPIKYIGIRFDITEQKDSEEKRASILAELNARMNTLDAAAIVSESDLFGNITFVNDKFCEVSQFTREELIGKPHSLLRHPETPKATFAAMWDSIKAGKIFQGVWKNKKKDGSHYWVDSTIAPVLDDYGKPVKYIGVRFDITAQKDAEERNKLQLKITQERELEMKEVLNALGETTGIIEYDMEGNILMANPLFLDFLGYREVEVAGKNHDLFVIQKPEYKALQKRLFENLRNGDHQKGDYRFQTKKGDTVWLEGSFSPIKDANGNPYKVIAYLQDITKRRLRNSENRGKIGAMERANGVVELGLDGTLLWANENFLKPLGYTIEDIQGKHHSILVEKAYANSLEYKLFWEKLNRGEFDQGTYKRVSKEGKVVWYDATYNPIKDDDGNIIKVIKYAQDVTQRRLRNSENRGKIGAMERASGVVELSLEGTLLWANENFLKPLGYTVEEIQGKHHSILVPKSISGSNEYKQFWEKLNRGEYDQGTYHRVGKNGQTVWYDATYNPIKDDEGNIIKVVKYAQDVTARRTANSENRAKLKAIGDAYAIVEFKMDGTIIEANENLLQAVGYSKGELEGQHHRILCEKELANSREYENFWAKLNHGITEIGLQKRKAKNGKTVWLQASYTPILDLAGKPFKVVKYPTDVTEQIELQLKSDQLKSELESRVAALNAAALMSETDLYGNITFVNDQFCEVAGYTREELMGKPHNVIRHPSTPKALFKELWEKVQSGKIFQGVYRNRRKDGSHYWVDATIAPVLGADGKPFKYVGIRFDVTKQVDQAKEFEGLMNAVGESNAMLEFSANGNIIGANSMLIDTLGYSEAELIGSSYSKIVTNAYAKSAEYKQFWEKLQNGEFQKGVFKQVSKAGEELWMEGTFNPIYDIDGNIAKIVMYAQDVTQRRLRNSENRGKLAAIRRAYGVVELALDGTLLTANETFLKPLGYTEADIKGKHHRILLDKADSSTSEYRQFWDALNNGEFQVGTYKRVGKQGQVVYYDATYNPITDDEGKLIKVVKYAQNVTDFKVTFDKVDHFLGEISKGNFDAKLDLGDIQVSDDLSAMIANNISLRDNLKRIITEINRVVDLAGNEGKLSERLQITNAGGAWGELVKDLNKLLDSISDPLNGVQEVVNALAQGDLTKNFDKAAKGDFQKMGTALNSALVGLNTLLLDIEESSNTVNSASNQMFTKSKTMESNTSSVVSAIQQISDGMAEQVKRTDESSRLVEAILRSAEDMGGKAEIINKSAEEGVHNSQNGMTIMKKLVENMTEIARSAQSTANSISILNDRSEEISRTLNVITDIASQTNLLALNAAIEAARAGDAGRGFAVVAEEIRKLAEDSRQSAVGIDKVIQDVQKDVAQATKAIDKMEDSVKNGNSATQEANTVFESIFHSSKQTFTLSGEVLKATVGQKDSIGNVVKNIEKIVVVSEETAAGTKNVARSSDELSTSMGEISSTSESLAEVASKVKKGVERFTLKK